MSRIRPLPAVLALALALAAAPAPALAQQSAAVLPDTVVLRPGDAVRILVWRQPELSGEYPIGTDGAILHPLLRDLNVLNTPLPEVDRRLRAILSRYETNPQFVIQPLFRVSVGGNVRLPSLYTMPPGTTVAQAIAMAGGLTERGNLSKVRLIRRGRDATLDLARPTAEGAEMPVASGDQVIVGRRTDFLRDWLAPVSSVLGAVAIFVQVVRN
jgi:polysaccharide export outer membrane protein